MRDGGGPDLAASRKQAQDRFDQLPNLSVGVFAARLRSQVREQQLDFAWFLGAGCSATSGIASARWLVHQWLDHLFADYERDNPKTLTREAWATRELGIWPSWSRPPSTAT